MEKVMQTYALTASVVDEVVEAIDEFCASQGLADKEPLRCHVSADYALYHWFDNGLEGAELTLRMGTRFGVPYVLLEVTGPRDNPNKETEDEYGSHFTAFQSQMGFEPQFRYYAHRNHLMFMLRRKPMNQLKLMVLVLLAAWVTSMAGMLLPAQARQQLLDDLVTPLFETFFDLLTCIAGPMIFLSVASGIYSIGDVNTFNRMGKRILKRFLATMLVALLCVSPLFFVLGPGFSKSDNSGGGEAAAILKMVFDIAPSNIIEPFATGNTLQIIFLAVAFALALLYLGNRTKGIAEAIDEINLAVSFLMGAISKLVPFAIFLVVVNLVFAGTFSAVLGMWKFLVVFVAAIVVTMGAYVLYTALARKVNPVVLARKCVPSFFIALTTSSSVATFGTNQNALDERFGVEPSLTAFGLPLGMVICRPVFAIYLLLIAFFFAGQYDVACNLAWLVTTIVVCIFLTIATPPVPGGGAVVYTMLFAQLGIPSEALALALAADLATDFFVTAFEMVGLLLTMVNVASDLRQCDHDVLAAP